MSRLRPVALAHLGTGWLLARHSRRSLLLLGHPDGGPRAVAVVRVLGVRHLVQGGVELRAGRGVLLGGAAVDVLHALSCLAYARRSGDRAGRRAAVLAGALVAAELLSARRGVPTPPALRPVRREPDVARVTSPSAGAWPRPTDAGQHVLVEEPQQEAVLLDGGVMDGATVVVPHGDQAYEVLDTDNGPQRYEATDEVRAGRRVFLHDTD